MALKEIIETIVREECFNGDFNVKPSLLEFNKKPHFEMHTSLETRETAIKYNPEYEEKNPGKTQEVIRDGVRHEINHHKYRGFNGCPRTLDNHVDLIYSPIAEVLIGKGYNSEDAHYCSNALEDTILHEDLSHGFSLEGIKDFFVDVGNNSKFTPFYQAHVMLNMYLWGNKKQKKELKKFCGYNLQVKEVLDGFLERTGILEIKMEIETKDNKIKVKDKNKIRDYLNDEKNWPEISRIYAEEFSKLMTPCYALPLFNHSGSGTKGRESENPNEQGNEFDKEMKTKNFRKSRIRGAYAKGKKRPVWMDSFESLDLLYESLAQQLIIKAETYTKQSQMPIAWYGSRTFDFEKDDFKHTSFGFDEHLKPELRKKRWHLDMPLEVKISQRGFPKSRFGILDTSGSMKEDFNGGSEIGNTLTIPWGDKSKYHGALVEWYSWIEYLKQNNLLSQTGIELFNISSETLIGKGLREAKKLALSPQFSLTKINLDTIKHMFEGRGNLIFSISDGDIENWKKINSDFIKGCKKHFYFHLQIGKPGSSNMTEDLQNANLYVEYINSPEELRGRTIDLTDKLLRGGD